MLFLTMGILLLLMGALANYGPLHSYLNARGRLEKANAGIAELTAQKAELQTELGRLSDTDYLESLARQDLSYTRPGEELYIVTYTDGDLAVSSEAGGDGTSQADQSAIGSGTANSGGAGFLERVLAPILDGP
jgi:cell division protein FtsB